MKQKMNESENQGSKSSFFEKIGKIERCLRSKTDQDILKRDREGKRMISI